MRIGIDIDGVLADSLPLWVRALNSFFKQNKQVENVHMYDILDVFNITPEEFNIFFQQKGQYLMTAPGTVKGAAYCLNIIKKYHDIYIITARDAAYKQETQAWLQRYGMPYDQLVLIGSHKKAATCLHYGLNVMVEDTLEVAMEISAAGIPVILLDAPYNQGDLPEQIYRRFSWLEIYRTLLGGTILPGDRQHSKETVLAPAGPVKL